MQLVVIKFLDPTFYDCWADLTEVDRSKCDVCYAAGWLLEQNEAKIKVGTIVSEDKLQVKNWIVLPAQCVLEVEVVKEVDWDAR